MVSAGSATITGTVLDIDGPVSGAHVRVRATENLTLDVPLTQEQARCGGQARILVPAKANCPSCRGHGGIGRYECARCAGEGLIVGDFPVSISFPAGLQGDHTVLVPLDRFGIRNMYLAVNFRPTMTDDF